MGTSRSRSGYEATSPSPDSKEENKSSRRRSRCRSKRRMRCRSGVKTTNPFLNYLRVFRRRHCGWPQRKVAIEGAKRWCRLDPKERQRYYVEACSMRRKSGRRRSRRRSRSRCPSRGRRSRRMRSHRKGRRRHRRAKC